jgi:hypothetical protein
MLAGRHREPSNVVIPGRAPLGAGPESILTMGVMDSGLDAIGPRFARTRWPSPRNDEVSP